MAHGMRDAPLYGVRPHETPPHETRLHAMPPHGMWHLLAYKDHDGLDLHPSNNRHLYLAELYTPLYITYYFFLMFHEFHYRR
uniref:Uncharacterized protein L09AAR n=1 Tax=African swine fever virus TaxID=10497 RepID=Q8V9S0_ASF|nr:putative protein [African swine fever virus]